MYEILLDQKSRIQKKHKIFMVIKAEFK